MRTTFLVLLFFLSTPCFSQSIKRSTIASLNLSQASTSFNLYSSLGQSSISGTLISTNGNVRQGFHQPISEYLTPIRSFPNLGVQVSVYPNPTNERILVALPEVKEAIRIEQYDVIGSKINEEYYSNTSDIDYSIVGNNQINFIRIYLNGELAKVFKVIKQ